MFAAYSRKPFMSETQKSIVSTTRYDYSAFHSVSYFLHYYLGTARKSSRGNATEQLDTRYHNTISIKPYPNIICSFIPIESSDLYFQSTTFSMEATDIAGLEWACVHDWKLKPDLKLDWASWMYKRVGELEVLVKQQRTEWMESFHPSVIQLNETRGRLIRR